MPIPSNISPATADLLVVDTPVTIVAADVELAPDGTGFTSNCVPANPQRDSLWWKYTTGADEKYIAFGVVGAPFFITAPSTQANYKPTANVWTETGPGVYTQYKIPGENGGAFSSQLCGLMATSIAPSAFTMYLSIPVTPLTTYYFQVQQAQNVYPIDFDLTVVLRVAPDNSLLSGSILIPDDLHGFPASVVSEVNGTGVLGYFYNIRYGELYAIQQLGGYLAVKYLSSGTTERGIQFFGPPLFTSILSSPIHAGVANRIDQLISDQRSRIYAAWHDTTGPSDDILQLNIYDAATGVLEQTQVLPVTLSDAGYFSWIIGISYDQTILYWIDFNDPDFFTTVHRWDLVNEVALSDFLPLTDATFDYVDGLVFNDGTILVITITYATGLNTFTFYSPSGVVLNTVAGIQYHHVSLDNTLLGFWVWETLQTTFTHYPTTAMVQDNQVVSSTVQAFSGGPHTTAFGFSDSCPLLVVPSLSLPPTPPELRAGIYFLDFDKRNDTLWENALLGTTKVVKIP